MPVRTQQTFALFMASAILVAGWIAASRWGSHPFGALVALLLGSVGTINMTIALNRARLIQGPRERSPVPPLWLLLWGVLAVVWVII